MSALILSCLLRGDRRSDLSDSELTLKKRSDDELQRRAGLANSILNLRVRSTLSLLYGLFDNAKSEYWTN